MRNSWLIAMRELRERLGSRSFVGMMLGGPVLILVLIYFLFVFGGEGQQKWNVLIADPTGIMDNKILVNENPDVTYSFANTYVEMNEFRDAKRYREFDALIEINEKILSNKLSFVFYRENPSLRMQTQIRYQVERRIEEVMVSQFTDLSIRDFRKVKQPLNMAFRNVYDPMDEASDLRGWVGLFYGTLIFAFIFLFGMTILRSVTREKSNRIVEVLLATVHPNQLMIGKIVGIGIAAFIQFAVWMFFVAIGLVLMRNFVFPDLFDPSHVVAVGEHASDQFFAAKEYNQFVDLVYERIRFGTMTFYFILFFVVGYLFYGALFAAIGATSGSESDGQQFVLPLIFLLCFALYAGYYSLENPESGLASLFHYLPFTSPVVVMVKLSLGYEPGHAYEIWMSLIILILSAAGVLALAGRLYKNGILQFGHRLRFGLLIRWLKRM
ncbi:MAG: ABC transporter permease [Flavobacteriia bacterium]|jgi:ABC-2 type transport system permease protein|nr:ABC transporter permease [Cryomorphaceae bacterium]